MPSEAEFLTFRYRFSKLEVRPSIDDPDRASDPVLSPQILQPLAGGDKIEAIKSYCELAGAGRA
jgi:hypothetical protein